MIKYIIRYIRKNINLVNECNYREDIFHIISYNYDGLVIEFTFKDLNAVYKRNDVIYHYKNFIKNLNIDNIIYNNILELYIFNTVNYQFVIRCNISNRMKRFIKLQFLEED